MDAHRATKRRFFLPAAVLFACAAAVSTSAVRANNGKCLRADVPGPMLLPDGTELPSGMLTLCVEDYSPVAAYHRVSFNGLPVGFLFSQKRVPERPQGSEPLILFRRTVSGTLRLVGYTWPAGKRVNAYLLQGEPWDVNAQKRIPAEELDPPLGEAEPATPPP